MFKRLALALIILVVVFCCLYVIDPARCWFAPKCLFKLLTGLNCPACGIQRFIHSLLNGRPLQAIKYNYYLVYALPYALLFGVAWIMPDNKYKHKLTAVIESKIAVWFYIVSFLLWLIIRNIIGI